MELARRLHPVAPEPGESFRDRVEALALAQAARDRELGVSPPDPPSAGQRRWQQLHDLVRRFQDQTEPLIGGVAGEANDALLAHGFRLQEARRPRLAPGELVGTAYRVASASGLEPSGTLNFKLTDMGRIRIEAEGTPLRMQVAGHDLPWFETEAGALSRTHVEAAFLSFLQGTMSESPHAFAE